MSDYVPTTWVAGGPPGISAENLNKIEQGIVAAGQDAQSLSVTFAFLMMGA